MLRASDLEKFRIFGGVKDLFGGFVFSKVISRFTVIWLHITVLGLQIMGFSR